MSNIKLGSVGIEFGGGNLLYNAPGGFGATWHDVLAARQKGVLYTNTTGRQLWVAISGASATGVATPIEVEGYTIFTVNGVPYMQSFLFCVNKGSQYRWGLTSGSIYVWKELYI